MSLLDCIINLYSQPAQEFVFNSHTKSKVYVEPLFTTKAGENIIVALLSDVILVVFEILVPFFSK
jgi:hypothetical protein